MRRGTAPVSGGQHTEIGRAINTLVQMIGLARDLVEVTSSVMKLVVPLSCAKDRTRLCVCVGVMIVRWQCNIRYYFMPALVAIEWYPQ